MLTQSTEAIPAPWLQALHRTAVPTHANRFRNLADLGFPDAVPCHADVRIRFTRRPNKAKGVAALPERVLYWAAGPCAAEAASDLHGAERAYGDYANMGVATRKDHTLEFVLQSPRPYVAQQRGAKRAQQWCRHLHFVDLVTVDGRTPSSKPSKPSNVLFTVAVFPRSTPLTLEGGTYTCEPVFAPHQPHASYRSSMFLGFEQYLEAKAAGALGVNSIQDPEWPCIDDGDMVVDWHASPDAIDAQLKAAKVPKERPLVVYCANDGCEAAQELLYKLTQIGHCNTYYMKHGMEEARAKLAGARGFLGRAKGVGGGREG